MPETSNTEEVSEVSAAISESPEAAGWHAKWVIEKPAKIRIAQNRWGMVMVCLGRFIVYTSRIQV
jgi:hypothetical protein